MPLAQARRRSASCGTPACRSRSALDSPLQRGYADRRPVARLPARRGTGPLLPARRRARTSASGRRLGAVADALAIDAADALACGGVARRRAGAAIAARAARRAGDRGTLWVMLPSARRHVAGRLRGARSSTVARSELGLLRGGARARPRAVAEAGARLAPAQPRRLRARAGRRLLDRARRGPGAGDRDRLRRRGAATPCSPSRTTGWWTVRGAGRRARRASRRLGNGGPG